MPNDPSSAPNSGRKLFFGLFIFPLLIAVGMAVLLCSVVLLTSEEQTPESLIADIKSGAPSKRWQKAFELSNELNGKDRAIRSQAVMKEIIHILGDGGRYDAKTRAYMALALGHFDDPDAAAALESALKDDDAEIQVYAMWSLGTQKRVTSAPKIIPFLSSESPDVRKTAAYVLGAMGAKDAVKRLQGLLDDASADVRWNAALALARLGDDSGHAILVKMLDRNALAAEQGMDDAQIELAMINAAKGLALIRKPDSIKILESISRTDKSMKVRQAALDSIRYQQSSKGL